MDAAEPNRARLSSRVVQFRMLLAFYGLYALTNMILLTINALTTPGDWWFLWVVCGCGVVVAAHAGSVVRGLFEAHLLTFIVGCIVLFVIDLIYSDRRWFYWMLLPWGAILALHGLFCSRLQRRYVEWEAALVSPESEGSSSR